jgi:parallel beta-helix repeat protein
MVPVATGSGEGSAWGPAPGGAISLKTFGAKGDGTTDDSAAVQAWLNAIAAATGLGAEGYADPGTYLVGTTPALSGATGIKIRGAGRASLFKAKAATQPNLLQFTGCTKILISGIAMDGNRVNVNQLGTQYLVLNGIWMQGCDDVTIEDCRIDNCYVSGIMANGGCTNMMIRGCRLTNCGDNQIYIRAQNVTPYTPCSNVTILNCVASGGTFSGIQGLGSNYFTVTGCVCFSNGPSAGQGNGIGSEGCNYFTFTGNVCHDNAIQGIQSRFTNEVGSSIQSTHGVIADNVCYNHTSTNGDAGGIGINDTDDIVLSGNLCYGNYYGVNVNGGSSLGVSHLKVEGGSSRGNLNNGFRLAPGSGSDYKISDFYSADNGADNLYCQAPVIIQGGSYLRATANHEGIHFASGSGGSLVDGAEVTGNTDNGILIDGSVGPVDVRNCWFSGSGTDQLRAIQEQVSGGPTTMVNCKIQNQKNNPFVFNNTASVYVPDTGQGWLPSDQGLIAQTFDAALMGASGATLTSGTVYLGRIRIPYTQTLTNALCTVGAAGVAITNAYLGLYNASGTLVAQTANRSADAIWTGGTGPETAPFTSTYLAAPGLYWIALLVTFTTTSPSVGRLSVITSTTCNIGLTAGAGNLRFATYSTGGQTVLPASFTPTTQLNGDNHAWWFGLN